MNPPHPGDKSHECCSRGSSSPSSTPHGCRSTNSGARSSGITDSTRMRRFAVDVDLVARARLIAVLGLVEDVAGRRSDRWDSGITLGTPDARAASTSCRVGRRGGGGLSSRGHGAVGVVSGVSAATPQAEMEAERGARGVRAGTRTGRAGGRRSTGPLINLVANARPGRTTGRA
jgi:hypothetical protein